MVENYRDVAYHIDHLRKKLGCTNQEVATKLKLSKTTIYYCAVIFLEEPPTHPDIMDAVASRKLPMMATGMAVRKARRAGITVDLTTLHLFMPRQEVDIKSLQVKRRVARKLHDLEVLCKAYGLDVDDLLLEQITHVIDLVKRVNKHKDLVLAAEGGPDMSRCTDDVIAEIEHLTAP
jgi:hypothetical protein